MLLVRSFDDAVSYRGMRTPGVYMQTRAHWTSVYGESGKAMILDFLAHLNGTAAGTADHTARVFAD